MSFDQFNQALYDYSSADGLRALVVKPKDVFGSDDKGVNVVPAELVSENMSGVEFQRFLQQIVRSSPNSIFDATQKRKVAELDAVSKHN